MQGLSFITDINGTRKAVIIDLKLLKDKKKLFDMLEDVEDELAIQARKNEPTFPLG